MEYSIAARLNIYATDDMEFRKFCYFVDMVQRDIIEEKRAYEKAQLKNRRK